MSAYYFTRQFDINVLDITLKLEQKYEELGAGVGCVGLTAACLGANVILTDLPEIIPLLERNVLLNIEYVKNNKGKTDVIPLPWGTNVLKEKPDIILLADCIYYIQVYMSIKKLLHIHSKHFQSIEPLICTLRNACKEDTQIFISQEIRESEKQQECWRYFLESINKYFKIKNIPLEEQDEEFRSSDIVIMQLSIS
ncbi:protein N-lysine methyltransferase METTL21D-like isoform X2 [Rhynchophorus ferrugineus]|uniref:protein N-lysine methyltransferase METTL21D-like isoform X2 n=1 Tax=Rhynchophorus ferrugineus TaxID=354439 RepID=UPI003FCEE442